MAHPSDTDAAFAGMLEGIQACWHSAGDLVLTLETGADAALGRFSRLQLIVATFLAALVIDFTAQKVARSWKRAARRGLKQLTFDWVKAMPIVGAYVKKEKEKAAKQMSETIKRGETALPVAELPAKGWATNMVKTKLIEKEQKDVRIAESSSAVSGTVYMAGEEHQQLLNDIYAKFSHTNPLHADVFPSVRQLEAEVVAITAALLGGGPSGVPDVCGAMTGGGSESILIAMKASRDYMRQKRGIEEPEMIVAQSAHAAYYKAAEYFGIRLKVVPVGRDYRLSAREVADHITSNTILVVASAPGYPHGVIDPVASIATVTRRAGILLHVDACLGGFVLPFARLLGRPVPAFDFGVPGVTSMSVDTHKYGMAHKGTSVVLYRSKELRKCQYTSISEWTGGLYISPGFAGSRSGALIATAWASLLHLGLDGFLDTTRRILEAVDRFKEGVPKIQGLEVMGEPQSSVVAFKAASGGPNMYKMNDLMQQRGWHLNALQFPPALHMCFTARHVDVVERLLKDLGECVAQLKKDPNCVKNGTASLYGSACAMPDRTIVKDLLEAYQDALLEA